MKKNKSFEYKINSSSIVVPKDIAHELLYKNFVEGTHISLNLLKFIMDCDDVFEYALLVFSGNLKNFTISGIDEKGNTYNSSMLARKNIYYAFTQAIRFESLKLDEKVRERFHMLKEMIYFSFYEKTNSDSIFEIDIEGEHFKIKCSDMFELIKLDPLVFVDKITKSDKLYSIKKEYFLYAIDYYFTKNSLRREYIFSHYQEKNLDAIKRNTYCDIKAINRFLTTKDTVYKEVEINPELKNYILSGIRDDFTLLEKVMYIYIKLCKTLTYDTEFYALGQKGKVLDKHKDILHIKEITLDDNEAVCFEINAIFTRFLYELGLNFLSSYRNSTEETYGEGHVNVEFRVDKFLILADTLTSIFTGDLFSAKLNKKVTGFICLNNNEETQKEFNESLEKVTKYIESEELFEYKEINRMETMDELLSEYKKYTDSVKEIPISERFAVMAEKINSIKSLKGMDMFSYIMMLGGIAFNAQERNTNIKFEIIKNNETLKDKEATPLGVLTINPNGFSRIPYENSYYIYSTDIGILPISYFTLKSRFEDGVYEHIIDEKNNIPGLDLWKGRVKMIEKLRRINDDIIETSLDNDIIKRHTIIKKIMEDDNCFFKIDMESSYGILRDIGIPENELKFIYMKLIDPSEMVGVDLSKEEI